MQDLCTTQKDVATKLEAHIKLAVSKWKQGKVYGELEGYIYKTALNFFNDLEGQENMQEAQDTEVDLYDNDKARDLLERFRSVKKNVKNAISTYNPMAARNAIAHDVDTSRATLDELGVV
jgi:hypothetical protein